jgi:hypothetical protein
MDKRSLVDPELPNILCISQHALALLKKCIFNQKKSTDAGWVEFTKDTNWVMEIIN